MRGDGTHARRWYSTTVWSDHNDAVWQVEVATIDPDTMDRLSAAVEPVGPFEHLAEVLPRARAIADALTDGQYPGQLTLL